MLLLLREEQYSRPQRESFVSALVFNDSFSVSALMATLSQQQEFEGHLAPVLDGAFHLAYSYTRHRDEAEDAVQDACLQAFRAFHSFRRGTNFKAWFLCVVANVCRQRHRRLRRAPQTVDIEDAPPLFLWSKTRELGLHSTTEDPAAVVMQQLDAEQVLGALETLPDEFREVATLYFAASLSYQEISEILDCPVGTVRSRLHRGRKLLQKALWSMVGGDQWEPSVPPTQARP